MLSPWPRSFVVQYGDHFRSGVICGSRSFAVLGSFTDSHRSQQWEGYVLFTSIASKLSKCQPPKSWQYPLPWRNSSRKRRLWSPPIWNCLGSQAMFVQRHSLGLEIGRIKGAKPATYFVSFTRPEKWFFFSTRLTTTLSSMLSFRDLEHV